MVEKAIILKNEVVKDERKRKPDHNTSGSNHLMDLSHTIEDGLVTYKRLPAPIICDFLSREDSKQFYEEGTSLYLRDCGVKLVGIDAHNIDNTKGKSRPVHTTLLGAEILIVEHLCNLNLLPKEGFTFSAIPPKWKGVGTFPVRAMAKIKNNRRVDK